MHVVLTISRSSGSNALALPKDGCSAPVSGVIAGTAAARAEAEEEEEEEPELGGGGRCHEPSPWRFGVLDLVRPSSSSCAGV